MYLCVLCLNRNLENAASIEESSALKLLNMRFYFNTLFLFTHKISIFDFFFSFNFFFHVTFSLIEFLNTKIIGKTRIYSQARRGSLNKKTDCWNNIHHILVGGIAVTHIGNVANFTG